MFAPSATGCQDKASIAVCDQLFNLGEANDAPPGPGQPVDPNRVVGCFQVADAPSQDVKNAAIETCPSYCGFCCVTPEFNCANSPSKASSALVQFHFSSSSRLLLHLPGHVPEYPVERDHCSGLSQCLRILPPRRMYRRRPRLCHPADHLWQHRPLCLRASQLPENL